MSEVSVQADRYSLALAEARRALDHQMSGFTDVRGRTVNLASVGSLAAAFLGGFGSRDNDSLTIWAGVGIGAFVLLLVIAVAVLWPVRVVGFAQSAERIVLWADEGDPGPETERNLAMHMWQNFIKNAEQLDRLTKFYTAGLILLILEVLAFLLDLRA